MLNVVTDLVEDASLHLVALALIGPVLTSEVPAAVLGLSELETLQTEMFSLYATIPTLAFPKGLRTTSSSSGPNISKVGWSWSVTKLEKE